MLDLSLQEIQALTELAEALYSFLPASAYPYSKLKIDFSTVAGDVGIGDLWPGGSKLAAIKKLLKATFRTHTPL